MHTVNSSAAVLEVAAAVGLTCAGTLRTEFSINPAKCSSALCDRTLCTYGAENANCDASDALASRLCACVPPPPPLPPFPPEGA
eukprot:233657-Prymnesium_polylepis.1